MVVWSFWGQSTVISLRFSLITNDKQLHGSVQLSLSHSRGHQFISVIPKNNFQKWLVLHILKQIKIVLFVVSVPRNAEYKRSQTHVPLLADIILHCLHDMQEIFVNMKVFAWKLLGHPGHFKTLRWVSMYSKIGFIQCVSEYKFLDGSD